MNEVKCSAEGCTEVFRTTESVSPNAKFTCRIHTGQEEIKGSFQESQFDRMLLHAHIPTETHHIKNQGSALDERHAPDRYRNKLK